MSVRSRELIWAATVGVVLADSSVVTLALPAILERFDTTVFEVSWVLTSFNVVLALLVLPAARLAGRSGASRAASVWAGGAVVFAAGSLACAVAPSAAVLIAGRCVQAVGGAGVVAGAIELLARSRGSHARAAGAWGAAGLVGLAVGPAAGGLMTELISWQSIFIAQVPLGALAVLAARPPAGAPERGRSARLNLAPEVALALLSAGLTGALFLLVIMLTEGWGASPLEAALVVSAMPAATLLTRALTRRLGTGTPVVAAGAVALAGGLASLGLLPDAEPRWTLAPQVLIGIGIALALPGLTARALGGADPAGRRAAGTIAARHVGIVVGIVVLTPIFTAELTDQGSAAQRSGTALILDAGLAPQTKIELGTAIAEQVERAGGRLTDLSPAFAEVAPPPEGRAEYARLEQELSDEVDKAATSAFSTVFLVAAALALLAVLPIVLGGDGGTGRRGALAPALAILAAGGLVGTHLALGGASYEPLEVADPCKPRPAERLSGRDQVLQRIGLSALDGAACRLRVTREELVLALADEDARRAFAEEHRISDEALERAVRGGLERAIDEADRIEAISPLEAELLRRAQASLPVSTIIRALGSSTGQGILGFLTDLLRRSG
jgi:MFS family permease